MLRTIPTSIGVVVTMVLAAGAAAAEPAVLRPLKTLRGGGAAQPTVVRSGGNFGGQGYSSYVSPWSGSIRYLSMPSVKDDVELVDDQIQKITQIRTDMQKEMSEMYKKMRDVSREERMERHRELSKELAEKVENQIKEVLLPEQVARLNQISLQMRLRSYYSLGQVLNGDEVAKSLGISDKQKKELLEVQKEVQKEMREKLTEFQAKLREEAQEKILKVLSKKQRDKLEKMKGEEFEYQTHQPKLPGSMKK